MKNYMQKLFSKQPYQKGDSSPSSSSESLLEHRRSAERETWLLQNNPTRMNYDASTTEDQAFPSLSYLDRQRKKPVSLSEKHITDTKSFALIAESTEKTFETLHGRALVMKYWIEQEERKSAEIWDSLNISKQEYKQLTSELKQARLDVSGFIVSKEYGSYGYGHLASRLDQAVRDQKKRMAIEKYKGVFVRLVDVVEDVSRVIGKTD